ncbi:translation initiation factor IF-2-like isoform X2 [Spea bombifrons]|uniref:translation initiation factor IF-2-like isoform X2 n=1 Tax=Spea bombifrons TaxID=233779 RepID=UPI00234A59A9|nr:translation initiation factor IF-2-like isoform X2 [Spea bombifrons]
MDVDAILAALRAGADRDGGRALREQFAHLLPQAAVPEQPSGSGGAAEASVSGRASVRRRARPPARLSPAADAGARYRSRSPDRGPRAPREESPRGGRPSSAPSSPRWRQRVASRRSREASGRLARPAAVLPEPAAQAAVPARASAAAGTRRGRSGGRGRTNDAAGSRAGAREDAGGAASARPRRTSRLAAAAASAVDRRSAGRVTGGRAGEGVSEDCGGSSGDDLGSPRRPSARLPPLGTGVGGSSLLGYGSSGEEAFSTPLPLLSAAPVGGLPGAGALPAVPGPSGAHGQSCSPLLSLQAGAGVLPEVPSRLSGPARQDAASNMAACTAPQEVCRSLGGLVLPQVWLIGHSYIFWARRRAAVRPGGEQLGYSPLRMEVRWFGRRGMRWMQLLPELVRLSRLLGSPSVLVVHLGGNDLGVVPVRALGDMILRDLATVRILFPEVQLVWSEVVARNYWRYASSQRALERSRVKLNRWVSRFVSGDGGVAVRHRSFERDAANLFRSDGVHLNDIGLDIFNLTLQDAIGQAMASVGGGPR